MFLLPNQKKIDEDGVIDAMLDTNPKLRYVLDTKTGEAGCIEATHEKPLDPERFVEIPRILAAAQLSWLKECIEFCMGDNLGLRDELMKEIKSGGADALERCENLLSEDESGWIHGWREWQGTAASEEMLQWFSTLPCDIEDRFEGCDDCELCKLMERGEHNIGDFLEAKDKEERKKKPDAKKK